MDVIDFGGLTDSQRADLEGDEPDPFDAAGSTLRYRPKDRHVGIRGDDGRLVASAGLVVAEVEVAGQRFPVVGLGGVIVNAGHRGRGLARQIVGAAMARARGMGPAFVVLFCHADRLGLYERLGFTELGSPVSVQQAGGIEKMPQRTMVQALRPGSSWPDGPVAIHSLPF
ncbi:MAG TPA: GNAT family N-acetyltransferase [Solirubrobacteraceae bacterium]|jgi:predicted N-acetyltransferase YhbS|nr:GNAT family N-acetyltransferase [Solirubrobacteraceae bacterium]